MLRVDIADNPHLQERGLSFVHKLEADKGMLFAFKRPQPLSFWGYHTYIPLDIAFVNANNEIVKIGKIKPHNLVPVSSENPCIAAIEANDGYFQRNGIKVGHKIILEMPKTPRLAYQSGIWDGAVVSFTDNSEGLSVKGGNTPSVSVKGAQTAPSLQQVQKKDKNPVGQPVTQDVNGVNLPVLDIGDIGSILEDSFDEQDQKPQPEQSGEEQQQETPEPQEKQYPVFSNAFEATEWAENNSEVVRISYTTKHGRALVRDVEPHGKFHSQTTGREILVTYDETIGDVRAFIVSNISQWAFTGRQFQKKFMVSSA